MTSRSDVASAAKETSRVPSQARLVFLVLEGYAYLIFIIATFVGAVALLMWGIASRRPFVALISLFIGLPLLLGTASVIRSLFFRIPDPPGVPLTPEATPDLHRLVHELRRQIGAPPVHRIVVGELFNASVVQLPRFGPLFPRNVLFIGYPLFATLSAEHLRAVIAHELGHMSRAHGRLSVMVYRLRQSWLRLMDAMWARGFSLSYAYTLFRWYAPRLHFHSAAVSRRQEFLADRLAAQIAGRSVAAETLVALGAGGSFMEGAYWRDVYAKTEHEPVPPPAFTAMSPEIWRRHREDMERRLSELLAHPTEEGDTHPSLHDRLDALGEAARVPTVPARTAADDLLGAEARAVAGALDAQWRERYEAEWTKRHASHQMRRQRKAELDATATPTAAQHFELGKLVEELESAENALAHYEAALAQGHAGASLAVGRIRLERNDESGVPLIERAIEHDPALVSEGCALLVDFLENRGRLADAHRYATMATRRGTHELLAATERNEVTAVDRFVPHGLGAEELKPIVALLEREEDVVRALLVTKEHRYSPGSQLVLAVIPKGTPPFAAAERLRKALELPTPGTVLVLRRVDDPLRTAIAATPGAEVYARHHEP